MQRDPHCPQQKCNAKNLNQLHACSSDSSQLLIYFDCANYPAATRQCVDCVFRGPWHYVIVPQFLAVRRVIKIAVYTDSDGNVKTGPLKEM